MGMRIWFLLSCAYWLQALLIQDGKLYGREPIFHVICKASALPESLKNHDVQKSEALMQLVQVIVKSTILII